MFNTPNNRITFTILLSWLKRVCDCRLVREFLFNYTGNKRAVLDSTSTILRPLNHGFSFSECSKEGIVPLVPALNLSIRKAAIAGAVAFIVIFPVDGKTGLVSVLQSPCFKHTEVVPSLTHFNSTTAVPFVVLGSFPVAAVHHALPDFEDRTVDYSSGHCGQVTRPFAVQGSIRFANEFDFAVETAWHLLSPYNVRVIQAGKLNPEKPVFGSGNEPLPIPVNTLTYPPGSVRGY